MTKAVWTAAAAVLALILAESVVPRLIVPLVILAGLAGALRLIWRYTQL